MFNWIEEARRFTPELRVLDYTGLDRNAAWDQLQDQNLVITTYGTVRRDIVKLREVGFDYVILDEAQAIKNATSQAAKACRLLAAGGGLAMTGTPVENHLGELWSLFEFLNPGMLGRHPKMTGLLAGPQQGRGPMSRSENDPQRGESLAVLGKALRPFLLRRTKQQVLTELPEKTEQTLYCELDGAQRELYCELRDHYRQALLARVNKSGLGKSKIHVLEALLRLRQAACHPGLLDQTKIDAGKLETANIARAARRSGRRRAQGPGLLAIHQLVGHRPRRARSTRASSTSTSTAKPASDKPRSSGSRPILPAACSSSASRRADRG